MVVDAKRGNGCRRIKTPLKRGKGRVISFYSWRVIISGIGQSCRAYNIGNKKGTIDVGQLSTIPEIWVPQILCKLPKLPKMAQTRRAGESRVGVSNPGC